ncbi:MAG: glycosyltransferase [Lachnospiraceae bacterium]|nr:glycosyltransferase [Lachnospiraceae bacterium]
MNVCLINLLNSYIDSDVILKLREMGHHVEVRDLSALKTDDMYQNGKLQDEVEKTIRSCGCDAVYTSNFFPIVARVCYKLNKNYISWQYDTPPNLPTDQDMDYPTNRIFFFNAKDCEYYKGLGIENVYYLPLAVNCDRRKQYHRYDRQYDTQVSLVGQLYNSTFPMLRNLMSEKDKGYLDGLIEVQRNIYGVFLPDELLGEDIMSHINDTIDDGGVITKPISKKQLSYSIATQVTHFDRVLLLSLLSKRFQTILYTNNVTDGDKAVLDQIKLKNPIDYNTQMPLAFYNSRINLCPILRNNLYGIPLRALDVMSCQGLLFANYHCGLDDAFEDGKEIVMYHSAEEAVELVGYYLNNEELRMKIAQNGYVRVLEDYRYEDRLQEMLATI